MQNKIIYLDNAATTLVYPEVLSTYNKTSLDYFANSSSIHSLGQKSAHLLMLARNQILKTLNLENHELIFTSGATESINLALRGYALMHTNRGKHIITSNAEHPAVLRCVEQLEKEYGFNVTVLPINKDGVVTLEQIKTAITEETILVSIMAVNNETGAISAIEDIAKLLLKYPKIAFHVDATQAIGKINIDYSNVDLISFSGHKIHALKNSGALIKNKNISLLPQNCGGGHENGYRSGTVDVASSASLAKAVRLVSEDIDSKTKVIKTMAEKLYQYLEANKDLYVLHSTLDNPYIINFSLLTKKASVVVEALSNEGIMVSSVSACHSKGEALSHVIMALTNNSDLAHNTLRISLDSSNKLEEIDILIENLHRVIGGVR